MKNKILFLTSLLACCIFVIVACDKTEESDSVAKPTSLPFIAYKNANDAYVYGQGSSHLYTDLPDVIAVAVDTVVGFEGGYGGKTGSDSLKISKNDVKSWPDTAKVGGSTLTFEKFNRANYKTSTKVNVVIAGPIATPGPTAVEGFYKRIVAAGNGITIEIKKVFDGVYVIDSPGGSNAVARLPYLLYNYKSSSGGDSLAFPIQTDGCGGGLQLVGPTAPLTLTSAAYTAGYPPSITTNPAPTTLKWIVLEFPSAKASSTTYGAGTCAWGTSVRTFQKQ